MPSRPMISTSAPLRSLPARPKVRTVVKPTKQSSHTRRPCARKAALERSARYSGTLSVGAMLPMAGGISGTGAARSGAARSAGRPSLPSAPTVSAEPSSMSEAVFSASPPSDGGGKAP